jgi:hypothetical protein
MGKRNLSGVYFRYNNPETGWEPRTFEDLPRSEQERILKGRKNEWVQGLALILADRLRQIGDKFDISC